MSIISIIIGILLFCLNIWIIMNVREDIHIWYWYVITGIIGLIVIAIGENGTFLNEIGILLLNNIIAFLILLMSMETKLGEKINIDNNNVDIFFWAIYSVAHVGGPFVLNLIFG